MEIVTGCGVGRAGRAHGRAWNQVKSSRVEWSRVVTYVDITMGDIET